MANGQFNAVASQLASTPQYVQEPVYQDYQYQQIDYNFELHTEIDYELKDTLISKSLTKGKREDKENIVKTAISGAHPSDNSGIVNQQVSETASSEILSDFSKKQFQELSETIVDQAKKRHLYTARFAFQEKNYGKTMDDIASYRLLQSLHDLDSIKPINEISKNLCIPTSKDIFEKASSDDTSGTNLNLRAMLENSLFISDSFPDEFADLKSVIRHIEVGKFQYEKDVHFLKMEMKLPRTIKYLNQINPTTPVNTMIQTSLKGSINTITQISSIAPAKVIKFITAKIKPEKKQPINIADKCLSSVVVVITPAGAGSGFFIDRKGHVITNYHVIENQIDIIVKTADGQKYFADIIASAKYKDLVLLKINGRNTRHLKIGSINKVSPGETVYALGAPGGLEQSITKGVVSAIRLLDAPNNPLTKIEFIQTDAAINVGNSGGPLINEKGEAIAINTQKIVSTDVEGISFSISIDEVKKSFSEYL
jgi:hypothetical protein